MKYVLWLLMLCMPVYAGKRKKKVPTVRAPFQELVPDNLDIVVKHYLSCSLDDTCVEPNDEQGLEFVRSNAHMVHDERLVSCVRYTFDEYGFYRRIEQQDESSDDEEVVLGIIEIDTDDSDSAGSRSFSPEDDCCVMQARENLLFHAIDEDNPELLKHYLSWHLNLDFRRDADCRTPLLHALLSPKNKSWQELVQLLLQKGSLLSGSTRGGHTVFELDIFADQHEEPLKKMFSGKDLEKKIKERNTIKNVLLEQKKKEDSFLNTL